MFLDICGHFINSERYDHGIYTVFDMADQKREVRKMTDYHEMAFCVSEMNRDELIYLYQCQAYVDPSAYQKIIDLYKRVGPKLPSYF